MSSNTLTKVPKILIISSAELEENIAANDAFVERLNARLSSHCELEWQNYRNIGLEISDGVLRAFIASDGRDIHDNFKAVYFKSYFRYHEQATSIAEAMQEHHTPFVGNELKHYIPAYKLSQMSRLARGGIRIPHTLYLPLEHYESNFENIVAKLGTPFIFKAIDGSTGDHNYLVKSKQQLVKIINENTNINYMAQAFISNESDLRVLIVGGKIRLVIERRRMDDSTHLNNTSQGAEAHLLDINDLNESLQNLSLHAAEIMERDIAGVDVMLEKDTGVPYILEVNASPQIATGAFDAEKTALYAQFFKELAES